MIKGITPTLAEGGKIKIGGLGETRTSQGGKQFRLPVKLDHFVVTRTTRDEHGDFERDDLLMKALADAGFADGDGEIRRLPIVLHSDEIDEVFPTTYAFYSGKKLGCRGDGEKAQRFQIVDGKRTGQPKEIACPCDMLNSTDRNRCCKPHGVLHCSIRLPGHAVAGSVHRWRTTSIISIQQMVGSLLQVQRAVGMLTNVPLILVVRMVDVSPEGGQPSKVPVCHVELRAADVIELQRNLLQQAKDRHEILGQFDALARQSYRAMLQAPARDDESDEEQAEVQAEFHSEQTAADSLPTLESVLLSITAAADTTALSAVGAVAARLGAEDQVKAREAYKARMAQLRTEAARPEEGKRSAKKTASKTLPDPQIQPAPAAKPSEAKAHEGDGKTREQREEEFRSKHKPAADEPPHNPITGEVIDTVGSGNGNGTAQGAVTW